MVEVADQADSARRVTSQHTPYDPTYQPQAREFKTSIQPSAAVLQSATNGVTQPSEGDRPYP
ncbi:hypothetical protein T265_07035 [Opisthorchis viverrini]|uniref:Uncharacterized protein n=1 Tax=Opisthorchis viverrini TaxID=6198 RepID=A0A074ZEC0_OPIVI|nr:hypothetical protein T265_07035 [Opisthorchis viverrini]KER25518.1 hypothetical protein T265_07035 [Opisthorchis viverrini]